MFGLITAGAAIIFGGAWVLCTVLEAGNRAKRERLERIQAHTERGLRKRAAEIEESQRRKTRSLRRRALQKAVAAAVEEEAIAVRHYKEMKRTIGVYLEQTNSAFCRKDELKRKLGERAKALRLKTGCRCPDIESDGICAMILRQIRELGGFCQSLVENYNVLIENKRRLFSVMRKCNSKASMARRRLEAFESEGYLLD